MQDIVTIVATMFQLKEREMLAMLKKADITEEMMIIISHE